MLDTQEHITAGLLEMQEAPREFAERITVTVNMTHLAEYGHETTRELVYGCRFAVRVGDLVKCPPTPLKPSWTTGLVTALDGGQYLGRVKYVKPHVEA